MDRDTYWLLNAAATDYVPLELITLEYNVTMVWNKPWHCMDEERLLHALHISFIEGDLRAMVGEDEGPDELFVPTMEEVRAAFARTGGRYIHYGLTAQGGARWEQASALRWDRFVDTWRDLEEGEITATTRELAGRYLASEAYHGIGIAEGSELWQELTPWPATYRKSLKTGHRVSFRYHEQTREEREPKPAWVEDLLAETDGWYTSIWREIAIGRNA